MKAKATKPAAMILVVMNNTAQIPNHNKTVYVLCGPTAVGKTNVAIALAKALNTTILSADSRQCYREITIGTAKPTKDELSAVKHYFIDSHSVTENITAATYEHLALQWLDDIFVHSAAAVVCGGTGLYINALCEGLDEMPQVVDKISKEVNETYLQQGLQWLQDTLSKEDPLFYKTAEQQNPARLLRALSFIRSTGISITNFRSGTIKKRPFNIVKIGLELPRELLYHRINNRVEDMMNAGLLKEAENLYPLRLLKNMQTVGYSELFDFFDGTYSMTMAIEKIKQHTRNYAKRQMTWFKKDPQTIWFSANDPQLIPKILAIK